MLSKKQIKDLSRRMFNEGMLQQAFRDKSRSEEELFEIYFDYHHSNVVCTTQYSLYLTEEMRRR